MVGFVRGMARWCGAAGLSLRSGGIAVRRVRPQRRCAAGLSLRLFFILIFSACLLPLASAARGQRAPRAEANLAEPAISVQHAQDRAKALASFAAWVAQAGGSLFAPSMDGPTAAALLTGYGQFLYDSDQSMGSFRLALLAVQDRFGGFTPFLRPAWKAITKWQILEPSIPHVPLPRAIWLAMMTVAIFLARPGFATALMIGFAAALRPGELLGLQRRNILLPGDLCESRQVGFVALPKHKTSRFGQSHVTIRDPGVLTFLSAMIGELPDDALIYPGSVYAFRRLWDFICDLLQVPHVDGIGYTPSSLRAGGVTDLYIAGMGIAEIKWHLRHRSDGSHWRYVQEAGAALRFARLPKRAKERIALFAQHAPEVLEFCVKRFGKAPSFVSQDLR